jgi:prophage antirepressor-like protein
MIVRHYTLSFGVFTVQRNFMGIELDVLVGHPEHELVFFGVQVASSAGIKDASGAVMSYRQSKVGKEAAKLTLGGLMVNSPISVPLDHKGRALRSTMAMLTEPQAFQMLLRGHAPASEPFRKWVTEEVLPTIRKTGKYDAEQSSNPAVTRI